MWCGLGPLFLVRLCSRSSQADGTALPLLLAPSWGFFRWHLWVSGSLLALEIRHSGAWKIVTFRIYNQCPRAFGAHLCVCMGPAHCCWVLSAARTTPVEAGVQHSHFHCRKWLYFCVCRSDWTNTAVVLGKSRSGGSIEAWFTVEGMSDWNINVDVFHNVDTVD